MLFANLYLRVLGFLSILYSYVTPVLCLTILNDYIGNKSNHLLFSVSSLVLIDKP